MTPGRTTLIHSVRRRRRTCMIVKCYQSCCMGKRRGGDAAYSGQRDVIQHHAPDAKSFIQAKAPRHRSLSEGERAKNRTKSKVRAKVEHAFLVIKRIFGWAKVCYQGSPIGSSSHAA
jgi:IS5 family transposase